MPNTNTTGTLEDRSHLPKAPVDLGASRKDSKIHTQDKKYDMYLNALPVAVRKAIFAAELDPRAIYSELRKSNKEAIIAKYANVPPKVKETSKATAKA